ncbi:hypothetical protein [Haloferula sargassicola]|uniref:Uncharacterized protein n=1 Tax=Haloferula sargassicola TaxID=490096 RepID=A0ABP9UTE4_9BACT
MPDNTPITIMIHIESTHAPDARPIEPELVLGDAWDPSAVADLIRSKSSHDESPCFLFLGKTEADLLRSHLGAIFGEENVPCLKDTYYMGLEVIEIACESFLLAGGRKTARTLQDPMSRRPAWRDADSDSLWHLRLH